MDKEWFTCRIRQEDHYRLKTIKHLRGYDTLINTIEAIMEYLIRKYDDEQITNEELQTLHNAGTNQPTVGGDINHALLHRWRSIKQRERIGYSQFLTLGIRQVYDELTNGYSPIA